MRVDPKRESEKPPSISMKALLRITDRGMRKRKVSSSMAGVLNAL
jgi:hypothetical protein